MIEIPDKDLILQTRDFLDSTLGQYIIQTLMNEATALTGRGYNITNPYPLRSFDKASGVIAAIDIIKAPLLNTDMTAEK